MLRCYEKVIRPSREFIQLNGESLQVGEPQNGRSCGAWVMEFKFKRCELSELAESRVQAETMDKALAADSKLEGPENYNI